MRRITKQKAKQFLDGHFLIICEKDQDAIIKIAERWVVFEAGEKGSQMTFRERKILTDAAEIYFGGDAENGFREGE